MKTAKKRVCTLTLNDECDVLTLNQTPEQAMDSDNSNCHYILEFKYSGNMLSSICFFDNSHNFICQVKAKTIETTPIDSLKKLNIDELKSNLKEYDSSSKSYKNSLINLFLYKRLILQGK